MGGKPKQGSPGIGRRLRARKTAGRAPGFSEHALDLGEHVRAGGLVDGHEAGEGAIAVRVCPPAPLAQTMAEAANKGRATRWYADTTVALPAAIVPIVVPRERDDFGVGQVSGEIADVEGNRRPTARLAHGERAGVRWVELTRDDALLVQILIWDDQDEVPAGFHPLPSVE